MTESSSSPATHRSLADEIDDIGAALVAAYGQLPRDRAPGPPLELATRLVKVRDALRASSPSETAPRTGAEIVRGRLVKPGGWQDADDQEYVRAADYEALRTQRHDTVDLRDQLTVGRPSTSSATPLLPTWTCGCSHVNGCNLEWCAMCYRRPNGRHKDE